MEANVFFVFIAFCLLVGMWADKRGREGIPWSALAFFISPIFAGIILGILPNLAEEKMKEDDVKRKLRKIEDNDEEKKELAKKELLKTISLDFLESIEALKKLYERGIISDTEYQTRKTKMINELRGKISTEDKTDFISNLIPAMDSNTLDRADIFAIKEAILF